MFKRLYASNFRTLVNFTIDFDPLTLLLGPNGAGKTTVFEVIRSIRDFVRGEKSTSESFKSTTLTRWQRVPTQHFEINVEAEGGEFAYHLDIEHDEQRQHCRVTSEKLAFDARVLFDSRLQDGQLTAQLYRDDGSKGPMALTDWTRSTLPSLRPIPENRLLTAFKERLSRVIVTRFNPATVLPRADEEEPILNWNASNFVAWFRHVAGLDLELVSKLRPLLSGVIIGLVGLSLPPDGADGKLLMAKFRGDPRQSTNGTFECRFDELSDGQQVLLMLYTLLFAATDAYTLCIDEPENFLSLREINPWLNMLIDRTHSQPCQSILISHHPELIDTLAAGSGRWIDRESGGHSRSLPIPPDATGLSVAELVARGWIHAQ